MRGTVLTYPAIVMVCVAIAFVIVHTWEAAVGSWLLSNTILFVQAVAS